MSTKSLLDPNRKTLRKRRRQAVRELDRFGRAFAPGSPGSFRVDSLQASLDDVRKDSRFTSEEKDEKFKAILNRSR